MFLQQLLTNPIYALRLIVIIVTSVTLHELGHGAAAMSQGDSTPEDTGHMTLNPIVHMGWASLIALCIVGIAWASMPVKPWRFKDGSTGRILVAAAGPMTNCSIAALCIIVVNLFPSSADSFISVEFFRLTALINIGLGLFNLIPVPPLDGFTVFSEFFPSFKSIKNHEGASFVLVILFVTGSFQFLWMGAEFILSALT